MHVWSVLHVLKIQDAKNRHFGTMAHICRAVSSQLRHASTIGKNLLNSNTSSTRSPNTVNFGSLTAEICWRVWGTQQISTGLASWHLTATARHCNSGRQPNFAALNRGRHLYSARRPSRWTLAHILFFLFRGNSITKWKKIFKVFLNVLVFYFSMEPRIKWNKNVIR